MYVFSSDKKFKTLGVLQRSKVNVKPWTIFEVKYYIKTVRDREKKTIEVSIDNNISDLR